MPRNAHLILFMSQIYELFILVIFDKIITMLILILSRELYYIILLLQILCYCSEIIVS